MATAAGPHPVSPSSSPRLPSPPPFTEVQIGPKSPRVSDAASGARSDAGSKSDAGAMRRIRPGTKAEDMASGPPLVPLNELDSPFQLQEHLAALHHSLTHPDKHTTSPLDREASLKLATPPPSVDRSLWLYELCRFLTNKINTIIISFFADSPPCSAATCPEMRASEWQYLCAVHDPPKPCCAIDYCCHTLDWAANMLTSTKHFPSRLTLHTTAGDGAVATSAQQPVRNLTNIFRRLYRIFAHAWYQHRGVFWSVEAQTGLYILFKTVCDHYQLIPEDNYTVPPEAEGLDQAAEASDRPRDSERRDVPTSQFNRFSILKKDAGDGTADQQRPGSLMRSGTVIESNGGLAGKASDDEQTTPIDGTETTRRHQHQHHRSTSSVTTVLEEVQEEEDGEAKEPKKDAESETEIGVEETKKEETEMEQPPKEEAESESLGEASDEPEESIDPAKEQQ